MRIAAAAVIGLIALAPHCADARPYRVTSIDPTVVQAVDIESIRRLPSGTSTAAITEIMRPGQSFQDSHATARVSLYEFECPYGWIRSLAVMSLAEDMSRIEWATKTGPWVLAGPAEEEAQKVVCAEQIDPKLNVEAPSEKALVSAIRLAIQ